MKFFHVNSSKAQIKIQEMAFVLVAIIIFFGLVALLFISTSLKNLGSKISDLEDEKAKEILRKMADSPEFSLSSESLCSECIDLDKSFSLKMVSYPNYWDLDFLQIKIIYPQKTGECTSLNYPDCSTITLINKSEGSSVKVAYTNVCFKSLSNSLYTKCELANIYASGKNLNE